MLASAHLLPFSVSYPAAPFFSTGRTAVGEVRLRDPADPARVMGAIANFVRFAQTGGLAGRGIDPGGSTIAGHRCVRAASGEIRFEFEHCLIDDASLISLCMLLLHKDIAPSLASVTIQGALGGRQVQLVTEEARSATYPSRWTALPFTFVNEEPETDTCSLRLDLAEPLSAQGRALLTEQLSAWTAFVHGGGFALSSIPPEEAYVEPDDPLIDFECTVEWAVGKLRADPAALDAWVNIAVAFHSRQQTIRCLSIE